MARSKGFTPDQKMEMRAAYEGGERLLPLSQKWGVSAPTMADYIRHAGGTLRNRGTPKKAQPRQMFHDTPVDRVTLEDVIRFQEQQIPVPVEILDAAKRNTFFDGTREEQKKKEEAEIKTPQAPVARRILPFE